MVDDETFRRSPAVDARELRDEAPNNVEDIMSVGRNVNDAIDPRAFERKRARV